MKILLTGGSGLLGTELKKFINVVAPTHAEMDITKPIHHIETFDLIIHGAAYTNVIKAEKEEKDECYKANVVGTINLLEAFKDIPFVYISSEYAKKPVNYYAKTKQLAEEEVVKRADKYLIIRTLFKPTPFPFPKAFNDQYTEGDYVDIITPLIIKAIESWDKKSKKMIYVGTGRKTIFELAKRTRPDVKPMSIKEITTVTLPADYR
jgi:dTDP-4-dehydrorhamnose reductase